MIHSHCQCQQIKNYLESMWLCIGQISGHWVQSFVHEVIGVMATGPWLGAQKAPPKRLVSRGSIGKAMIFNIFLSIF